MKKILSLLTILAVLVSCFGIVSAIADEEESEFEGGGDLSRLNVPKTTYEFGEPILISAVGSGLDWVGLYFPDDLYSLQWTYIDASADKGVGSGVEFDVRTAGTKGSNAPQTLPCGEYIIRLLPNDSSNFNNTIAWVKIKIVIPKDTPIPEKPVSATYELNDPTSGIADGKLTVNLSENEIAKNIVPYWGNENGKLEGYTALAKFKAKSTSVTYEFPKKMIIPEGATKLLIYTSNYFDMLSEDCYVIDLPAGSSFKNPGKPIVEFQVVSDIHVVDEKEHTSNTNYVNMLKDIISVSPESMGIFIAGDMVDYGYDAEYRKLKKLYESVEGAPPQYMAIGNHDMFAYSYEQSIKSFLKNATLPDGSHPKSSHYDFWLNGYHFVFLGNDNLVSMLDCTLTKETIAWLDKTLAEDRDAGRPTFLFIHQGMKNTVAGTLGGQGWNGIVSASELLLRTTLRKYPEVVMFCGHSHWDLDSEKTMLPKSGALPNIFNTSSVSYLYTSYNQASGERREGSEGYYLYVYEDKILVLGRNFQTGEWVPSAQFIVEIENGTGQKKNVVSFDTNGVGTAPEDIKVNPNGTIELPAVTAEGYNFIGWYTDKECTKEYVKDTAVTKNLTLYAKWEKLPDPTTPTPTPVTTEAPVTSQPVTEDDVDNSSAIIIVAVIAVVIVAAVIAVVIIKKKKK